jgi:hypothetical protein
MPVPLGLERRGIGTLGMGKEGGQVLADEAVEVGLVGRRGTYAVAEARSERGTQKNP